MIQPRRRYRIEGGSDPQGTPDRRPAAVDPSRTEAMRALAGDLGAMREAITTTRGEIADLKNSPAGRAGMQKATSELDAVSSGTQEATTTILGAVEEIEAAVASLNARAPDGPPARELALILDRVRVLYEACNFQDIAGQRLRKVVQTLHFVEGRLDRMIAVWDRDFATIPHPVRTRPGQPDIGGREPLAGPRLPGDTGHVSQEDVDLYFI